MSVQVGNSHRTAPANKVEDKAAGKAKSERSQDKGIFDSLLNSIKGNPTDSGRARNSTAGHQHRPPSSMLTNPEFHKAHSASVNSPPAQLTQSINNMAVSALISLRAMSSGQNRMNNVYSIGSGMSGQISLPAASGSGTAASNHSNGIGRLSAKFESGENGPEVIGFDAKGGTSYGTFQISSKAGTMRQFIDYLSEKAPELSRKLAAAGSANTGGRGGKMPEVWKKIAQEEPARFSKLQYDFIEQTHYQPALQEVAERTGVDIAQAPKALKEVLWSTAVQHGPRGAAKIFAKAIGRSQAKDGGIQVAQLINSVYRMRAGQFGSSTADIRTAVHNRFKQEGKIALAMLSEPYAPDSARA